METKGSEIYGFKKRGKEEANDRKAKKARQEIESIIRKKIAR